MLNTYAEVSPSGSGVKLFLCGKSPFATGKKKVCDVEKVSDKTPAIEIYDWGRYFAVTGWQLIGPNEPESCQEQLEKVIRRYFPNEPASQPGAAPLDFRSDSAVVARARKYLAKLPPAISGHGGDRCTFHAACVLVLGFELPEADALALLHEYNKACQPPWSEKELLHKVRSAAMQPGERGYLRNARPDRWAAIPSRTYQEPQRVGSDSDSPAKATRIADIILQYFRTKYQPVFRHGATIWSSTLSRVIGRTEACGAPNSALVDELLQAVDFPHSRNGPDRGAAPGVFRNWAQTAWQDLLDSLPDELDSPEIAEDAREKFRAGVGDVLRQLVVLGHTYRSGKDQRTETARRSLIEWARIFAKPGGWKQVRSYQLWCKIGEDGKLQVAMHRSLYRQVNCGGLAPSNQNEFRTLAENYGVGIRGRVKKSRFVELSHEFINELLSIPGDEIGDNDGDASSAHAREDVSPSSSPISSPDEGVSEVIEEP